MFKTNSRKMKDVMSKLRNILGDEFNDRVKVYSKHILTSNERGI